LQIPCKYCEKVTFMLSRTFVVGTYTQYIHITRGFSRFSTHSRPDNYGQIGQTSSNNSISRSICASIHGKLQILYKSRLWVILWTFPYLSLCRKWFEIIASFPKRVSVTRSVTRIHCFYVVIKNKPCQWDGPSKYCSL